jgi:PAS domain-containing protein
MDMLPFFKSVLDQDPAPVVICDMSHEIVYMNPSAVEHYSYGGGSLLLGRSIMDCHNANSRDKIAKVVEWFSQDESHNVVHTFYNESRCEDVYMVALRDQGRLIGYYEKHESRIRDTGGFYSGVVSP